MADDGKVSISIRGRSAKLHTLAGGLAIAAARQNHDPIFEKYTKLRKLMKKLKHMLMIKYGPTGLKNAMKTMEDDV